MFKNFLLIIIILGLFTNVNSQYNEDDDGSFLDYTIKNELSFFNDTYCNITSDTKKLTYRCECKDSTICLKNYFNSSIFNTIKIKNKTLHKLCNINFTDSYNYNRCISCDQDTSIYYTIESENLCQEMNDFWKTFMYVMLFLVFGVAFAYIFKIRYDRKKGDYLRLDN